MNHSLRNRSLISSGGSRPIPWRKMLPNLGIAIFAVVIGATLAFAAGTQIFDPQTRKWVDYDRKNARKYYAAHKQVPEAFRRQVVTFRTAEKPGTIIIDGNQHFLYLVQPGLKAIRYGIGVGREGYEVGRHRSRRAHCGMADLDAAGGNGSA